MSDHIDVDVDASDSERELDRLGREPDLETRLLFLSVLFQQFEATQVDVHRMTNSLATSGRYNPDFRHGRFEGTITYGGPAPSAVHDPVRYAWFEQRRGGEHNFMAAVDDLEGRYREVILEHFRGRDL